MINRTVFFFMLLAWLASARGQVLSPGGVFGNGGAGISGSGYRIGGTLGQSAAGEAAASAYRHGAGFWYVQASLITGVAGNLHVLKPAVYKLYQSYPNPFNPSSVIGYAVPEISEVTISVYDVRGKLVESLFSGVNAPGFHEVVFKPVRFSSGMYFCVMSARSMETGKSFHDVRKTTFVK